MNRGRGRGRKKGVEKVAWKCRKMKKMEIRDWKENIEEEEEEEEDPRNRIRGKRKKKMLEL